MIQLQILPRIAVEERTASDDTLVISIVTPGIEHPKIYGEHVFKFSFHDVAKEYFLEANDYRDEMWVRPMEYETAEGIVEVAMANRDKKYWIIHCEAGISRSPGVAIGLARYLYMDPNLDKLIELYPMYNKYVRELIEKAMIVKLEEIDKELLKGK